MFAAAQRSDAVRSLTMIEPPVLQLVRGDPEVESRIATIEKVRQDVDDPREFHLAFAKMLAAPIDRIPDPLPAPLERQIRLLMNERPPWEASPPFDVFRDAQMPVLLVSGGWDPVQEATCDRLVERLGPTAERAVVRGKGHGAQRTGAVMYAPVSVRPSSRATLVGRSA